MGGLTYMQVPMIQTTLCLPELEEVLHIYFFLNASSHVTQLMTEDATAINFFDRWFGK